jgi:hypothetical protein
VAISQYIELPNIESQLLIDSSSTLHIQPSSYFVTWTNATGNASITCFLDEEREGLIRCFVGIVDGMLIVGRKTLVVFGSTLYIGGTSPSSPSNARMRFETNGINEATKLYANDFNLDAMATLTFDFDPRIPSMSDGNSSLPFILTHSLSLYGTINITLVYGTSFNDIPRNTRYPLFSYNTTR